MRYGAHKLQYISSFFGSRDQHHRNPRPRPTSPQQQHTFITASLTNQRLKLCWSPKWLYWLTRKKPIQQYINFSYCNIHQVTLATVCVGWFVLLGLECTRVHMSRSSTLGSSTTDLILRRKVTASLPSIRRWS